MLLQKIKEGAGGILILIAISCITHWHWLVLPGIFADVDFWFQPNQFFVESFSWPSILNAATGLAVGIATPTFASLFFIGAIIQHLHIGNNSFDIWERLLFLWPMAFLAPIPIYLFLLRTFRYVPAAMLGSIIYTFNSYVLAREVSHPHIAIVYFIAPAILLALELLITSPSRKHALLFIATTTVASIYEPRILYICAGLFALYGVFLLTTRTIQPSKKLFTTLAISISVVTLAQSYWLIPFVFTNSSLGYATITNRGLFQSFTYIPQAVTLSDPFWTGKALAWFVTQPVPAWSYILPLFVLVWIFFKKQSEHRAKLWFWLGIALVGIFLIKESNQPFPNVYSWLFTHIPGFKLFRDASKFTILVALPYAILATASMAALRKKQATFALIGGLLVALCTLSNTIPFITGSIGYMGTPRDFPTEYKDVQATLEQDASFGRSLWAPADNQFIFASQNHPRLSMSDLANSDWSSFVQNTQAPLSIINQPIIKSLLNFASITYVGLPAPTVDHVYQDFGKTIEEYQASVQAIPDLQKIENIPTVSLWKNPDAKPLVYLANNTVAVHEPVRDFSGIDPTLNTAFIFQETTLPSLFKTITDTVATNEEFAPFLPENIVAQNGTIVTNQGVPPTNLVTVTRNDTQDTIAEIIMRKSNTSLTVLARYANIEQVLATTNNSKQDFIIQINNQKLSYTYDEKTTDTPLGTTRLSPTGNSVRIYQKIQSDSLLQDPSFETGTWGPAGDCSNTDNTPSSANAITVSQSNIATDGEKSLKLAAGHHLGCATGPVTSVAVPALYIGSFDYQHLRGDAGSIKVVAPSVPTPIATVQLTEQQQWQHREFSFTTDGTITPSIYLYQPSNGDTDNPAASLFDNFRISAYQLIAITTANLQKNTDPLYTTKLFKAEDMSIPSPASDGTNIVQQFSFEKDTAYTPGDCNNTDGSSRKKNGISAKGIDIGDGKTGLEINAKRHIACMTFPLASFDPTYDYLLSVRYKTNARTAPYMTLYPSEDATTANILLPLTNGEWSTYTTIASGKNISPDASIIIYIPTDMGPSQVDFDFLTIKKVPILPSRYIQTALPTLPILQTSAETINPALHILHVADIGTSPRMLVLSNRYDTGWKVFVRKEGAPNIPFIQRITGTSPGVEISQATHVQANGFANGWVIDPEEIQQKLETTQNIELAIEYTPQRVMDIGTAASLIVLILLALYTTATLLIR